MANVDINIDLDNVDFTNNNNGFKISNIPYILAGQSIPNARLEKVDGNIKYAVEVQDTSNLGGGLQVIFSAINQTDFSGYLMRMDSSEVSMQKNIAGGSASHSISIVGNDIKIKGLPIVVPTGPDKLWNDSGTLKIT